LVRVAAVQSRAAERGAALTDHPDPVATRHSNFPPDTRCTATDRSIVDLCLLHRSGFTDIADLIDADPELFVERVAWVSIMGGLTRTETGWEADEAQNNMFDIAAARKAARPHPNLPPKPSRRRVAASSACRLHRVPRVRYRCTRSASSAACR